MENSISDLYKLTTTNVRKVYVFPRILSSSQFNPYLQLLYEEFLEGENRGGIDVSSPHPLIPVFIFKRIFLEKSIVHYHWLEFSSMKGFFIVFWKMFLLVCYKITGGKIVWTPHNKQPHAKRYFVINMLLYRLMAKMATRIHVHCNEAIKTLIPILQVPEKKFYVVRHPDYKVKIISQKLAIEHIQKSFSITLYKRPVFLVYGYIAEYKGILEVLPFFIGRDCSLIIAGKCKKGEEAYLDRIVKIVNNISNIILIEQFLSSQNEMHLFNASDCVVFNLKDFLSSGSVVLARSYKKMILVPDTGCCKDLDDCGVYKFSTLDEFGETVNTLVEDMGITRI